MSHQHSHVIFAECFEEMTDEEILVAAIYRDGPLTPWHEAVLKEQADRGLAQPHADQPPMETSRAA